MADAFFQVRSEVSGRRVRDNYGIRLSEDKRRKQ